MSREFLAELAREWAELKKYKFNLIFANLGILAMLYYLVDHLFVDQQQVVFLLLIIWYFSTHGLQSPTYILEDEVLDRTLINIIQSRTGVWVVVARRCLLTVLMDVVKAVPLFTLLFFLGGLQGSRLPHPGLSLLVIGLAIYAVYALGLVLASFTLVYKRLSGLVSLAYYYILFFAGLTAPVQNPFLRAVNDLVFPFQKARALFEGFQEGQLRLGLLVLILVQGLVFTGLARQGFAWNIQRSLRRGGLYGL